MQARAKLSCASDMLAFRERYREEMDCQIVHDSIHRRTGWTLTYGLELDGVSAGFGSVAIGGPWKDRPTLFEFYVLPEHRSFSFDLFEELLSVSGPRFMEIQSNDALLAVMLHTYARDIASEKIVFHDKVTTALPACGTILRRITSDEETRAHIEQRQGGPEWVLELDGNVVAKGGILFHYNRPYGDIYMEVGEAFRRRGLGSYLVQELKRAAYDLGSVPCARCSPTNVPSRRTLQKAGFIPFAHMLTGVIPAEGAICPSATRVQPQET
jgi:GNAT superfamily N-acetyltransferase